MPGAVVERLGVKVDAPIGFVSKAVLDESLCPSDNLRNILGYSCHRVGMADPQPSHVLEKPAFPKGRERSRDFRIRDRGFVLKA
jgi:hypothetical protein